MATDMTAPVKERYDTLIQDGLVPLARWGTPEDVGKAAAAIAMDSLPFSTGEVLNIHRGISSAPPMTGARPAFSLSLCPSPSTPRSELIDCSRSCSISLNCPVLKSSA